MPEITHTHMGIKIVQSWDADCPEDGDCVTAFAEGEEWVFNTLDEARDYIDSYYGEDPNDYYEEHRLRGWQLV